MKTSEARSARAAAVNNFLREIQFEEMMQKARDELVDSIVSSAPHETKMREANYQLLTVMAQFRQHIGSILADGTVSKLELNRSKR